MKKILIPLILLFPLLTFAQKPDFIRTPNGPNTIVDWNLKAKTLVLPHGPTLGLQGSQDTTGNVFFHVGDGDTSLNIRVGGLKWWNPANYFTPKTRTLTINGTTQDLSINRTFTVTATASNSLTLGNGLLGTSYNGSAPVTSSLDTASIAVTKAFAGRYPLKSATVAGFDLRSNITLASLTNGYGVNSFTYNGSGAASVVIDTATTIASKPWANTVIPTATLARINNVIPKLSKFADLNTAVDFCYDNGIKYLNVDIDYYTTTQVSYKLANVLLVGKGRIGSNVPQNYSLEVGAFGGEMEGEINRFQTITLDKLRNNSAPFVIVIYGVSIDVGYDDPGTYKVGGADQSNPTNSWPDYLIAQLKEKFPNKQIQVYNRAIGGGLVTDYNTKLIDLPNSARFRTPANENKTWLEEIRDLQPDLIINSLGMNDNDGYDYQMQGVNDLINAWTKVPEVVVLTTPSPNYTASQIYTYRLSKFHIQSFQNQLGRYNKQYQIDVARQYNIKVFGTDFNEFALSPSTFGYTIDPNLNSTAVGTTGFTMGTGTANVKINTKKISRDFALKFTLRHTTGFSILKVGNALNGWFNITPTQITGVPLADIAIGQSTAPKTFAANTDYTVYLEYTANQMRAFVNDTLICANTIPYAQSFLWENFNITGNLGTVTISNLQLFDAEYRHFLPAFTQAEAWGALPTNGNAINHPSEIGLKEIYFPPIKEFVSDMYEAVYDKAFVNRDSTLNVGINEFSNGKITLNSLGNVGNAGGIIDWKMNVSGGNNNSYIGSIRGNSFSSSSLNTLDFHVGAWNNNNVLGAAKMRLRQDGLLMANDVSISSATATRIPFYDSNKKLIDNAALFFATGANPSVIVSSNSSFGAYLLLDNRTSGNNWGIEGGRTLGHLGFYSNSLGGTAFDIDGSGNGTFAGGISATLPTYSSGSYLPAVYNSTNNRFEKGPAISGVPAATDGQFLGSYDGGVPIYMPVYYKGRSTTTGTATTTVTVTIGTTQANNTYAVTITPRDLLTAVNYYISAQTTTTFDVTFVSALTGSIDFSWTVLP